MIDKYPSRVGCQSYLMPVSRHWPDDGQYCKYGYTALKSFVSSVTIDRIKANEKWMHTVKEPHTNAVRTALAVHQNSDVVQIVSDLTEIAENILESGVYIHQSRINFKAPGESSGWSWHSDFETWHTQDGMPEMRALTAMIALDANTSENGPLRVIPGSHSWYWADKRPDQEVTPEQHFADQKTGVPNSEVIKRLEDECLPAIDIHLNSGDVLLFDCNLMHSSQPNNSKEWRRNLFIVFNSVENKLVNAFSYSYNRPETMAARG